MCDNARCVTSAFSAKPIPRGFTCNSTVTGLVLELCLVTVFSLSSLRRFRRHGQEAGVSATARDVAANTRSSPRGARGAPACASAVGVPPAACQSSLLFQRQNLWVDTEDAQRRRHRRFPRWLSPPEKAMETYGGNAFRLRWIMLCGFQPRSVAP